ncbi:Hsp20/alpha crystallin family protein [Lacticaseibacillus saniviri]|uniref:Hsp20 family small heat shock protein n=1 Tax=Lacticaseibacillus saniviri JCM 17471 = DSM 24301 TaxID=1293598 RepID=A0A0R2MRS5_9LACO|nr:Hsp20/alpha crystallin family protein [Lacticaseibacillus saniviri]KRO16294.1 Hsp20 family small heat shock protein [Lacticaseibacillus saniviri JCM 17471 = DSM 24301]MCG4281861.1 Hsp20/alpha crystallin family protein [Lacticaseibacillus saniviri]
MANNLSRRNDWLTDPVFGDMGRRFFDGFLPTQNPIGDRVLKTDIKDTDKAYIAKVDVPGIDKKDIQLNYQDNVLSISVKKDDFTDHEDEEGNLLMSERNYGRMSRSYRIPNVDEGAITAAYDAGVLTVTLPKLTGKPESTHQIDIN